mgnify:CR=1 FL=1
MSAKLSVLVVDDNRTNLALMDMLLRKLPHCTTQLLTDPQALVAAIERRLRHHLSRARAAALAGPTRTRLPLATRVADLAAALTGDISGLRVGVPRAFLEGIDAATSAAFATALDTLRARGATLTSQELRQLVGELLEHEGVLL